MGIEVKRYVRWRPSAGASLRELHARGVICRAVGICGGERAQQDGPIQVLPVRDFLQRLPAPIPGG